MIYLDNAATTLQKPPEVLEAAMRAMTSLGNPGRGGHAASLAAARCVYHCREQVAQLLSTPGGAKQVVFTSGATESLNGAISGLFRSGMRVVTTALEHNSVLRPLYALAARGLKLEIIPADGRGRVDLDALAAAARGADGIVCTHASNLCGNALDIRAVAAIARRTGARLVVDASQSAGLLPLDMGWGIDAVCFSAHKGLCGIQGLGVLAVREGVQIAPWKTGGSGIFSASPKHPDEMPARLEAGTLNVPGIAALSAALDVLARDGQAALAAQEQALAQRFFENARQIPGLRLYGDFSDFSRRAPVFALNLGELDSSRVADALEQEYGILTRAGLHCAPLAHKAFGTLRQGAVRLSFSRYTTQGDVDAAVSALRALAI